MLYMKTCGYFFRDTIFAAGNREKDPKDEITTELEVRKVLAEGLINHVSGSYDDCWPELCIIKKTGNAELKADGIDLNEMNDHKQK